MQLRDEVAGTEESSKELSATAWLAGYEPRTADVTIRAMFTKPIEIIHEK